jgi:hypothetical protein
MGCFPFLMESNGLHPISYHLDFDGFTPIADVCRPFRAWGYGKSKNQSSNHPRSQGQCHQDQQNRHGDLNTSQGYLFKEFIAEIGTGNSG